MWWSMGSAGPVASLLLHGSAGVVDELALFALAALLFAGLTWFSMRAQRDDRSERPENREE